MNWRQLVEGLEAAERRPLRQAGKLAVVTFHSLEETAWSNASWRIRRQRRRRRLAAMRPPRLCVSRFRVTPEKGHRVRTRTKDHGKPARPVRAAQGGHAAPDAPAAAVPTRAVIGLPHLSGGVRDARLRHHFTMLAVIALGYLAYHQDDPRPSQAERRVERLATADRRGTRAACHLAGRMGPISNAPTGCASLLDINFRAARTCCRWPPRAIQPRTRQSPLSAAAPTCCSTARSTPAEDGHAAMTQRTPLSAAGAYSSMHGPRARTPTRSNARTCACVTRRSAIVCPMRAEGRLCVDGVGLSSWPSGRSACAWPAGPRRGG